MKKIENIIRGGVSERQAIIEIVRDMNNWAKSIGGNTYGPEDTV